MAEQMLFGVLVFFLYMYEILNVVMHLVICTKYVLFLSTLKTPPATPSRFLYPEYYYICFLLCARRHPLQPSTYIQTRTRVFRSPSSSLVAIRRRLRLICPRFVVWLMVLFCFCC